MYLSDPPPIKNMHVRLTTVLFIFLSVQKEERYFCFCHWKQHVCYLSDSRYVTNLTAGVLPR